MRVVLQWREKEQSMFVSNVGMKARAITDDVQIAVRGVR
jgi:hypothetical protein